MPGRHPIIGHGSFVKRLAPGVDPTIHGCTYTKVKVADDLVERHELFLLDEGEQKVTENLETRTCLHPTRRPLESNHR